MFNCEHDDRKELRFLFVVNCERETGKALNENTLVKTLT
jgi:hypothetical protein